TVTLNWAADANATLYDVEVANDVNFTTMVTTATVSGNSHVITGLSEATNYFWRVRPRNETCSGTFSTPYRFTTGVIACASTASSNVPLTISASGTPTINSTLNIPTGVNISD